jgi:hypothetical protein
LARYNTFQYGDGTLYGAEAAPGVTEVHLLWSVLVDWDADGFFSGENEAAYLVGFSLARGRDHYVDPQGQGFERYGTGRATLILDNDDGRFNPFNTSSPLYPYVTPGKRVRINVLDRDTGTDHELMRGMIADIQPYNQGNRKMVRIEAVDGQEWLRGRTVRVGYHRGTPYEAGVSGADWTTGKWVDLILQRAGWPSTEWPREYNYFIDLSGNQVAGFTENFYRWAQHAWFWVRDAYEAVQEMADVEMGTFLHARDGRARFLSSHFTYDKVVQLDESELLRDITTPQPWETLRNRIEVRVHYIRNAGAVTTLWAVGGTGNDAIPLPAGSSKTFDAQFRYGNFHAVPVGGSGYGISFTVNSLRSGAGMNLTAQCVASISEVGDGATISLQNNSGTNGYIINLSLTADPLYRPHSTIVSAEDGTSQGVYGTRVLGLDSPWMQEFEWADTLKAMLVNVLSKPTQYPVVRIEKRADKQFGLDLYVDAIHLTSATLGINALYRIGKIEHLWLGETGDAILTTLRLEPYFALDAPAELDYEIYNPFDSNNPGAGTSDEIDVGCEGDAVADGFFTWCNDEPVVDFVYIKFVDGQDDHTYGDYSGGNNGFVLAAFDGADVADFISVLSTPVGIGENYRIAFWYQWQDTNLLSPSDEPIQIIVGTTESGSSAITESVPLEIISGAGEWQQYLVDLSDFAGEHLTRIVFHKGSFDGGSGPLFRMDDLAFGKFIYAGDN